MNKLIAENGTAEIGKTQALREYLARHGGPGIVNVLMPGHTELLDVIAEQLLNEQPDYAGEQLAPNPQPAIANRQSDGIPRMVIWRDVTTDLPDDDTSVLVYVPEDSEPVWIGFHDAGVWRCPSGMPLTHSVTHWAHLPEPPTRP